MNAAKKSSVRKSFLTPQLPTAKYEIRVRRTNADSLEDNILDTIYLSDVNEILLEKLSYPNTALVALKIRLTDQLSNIPKVTYINGGRIVKEYGRATPGALADTWYDSATRNPAWVTWDILTNKRYGGGMPVAKLDLVAFKNWADYCTLTNLTWNGVIEEGGLNVWDACQLVLHVGHAQIVNVGTRFTVVVEKAADPVMMFSVSNMIEGSYKETWLGTADRANEIDVTFFDKTNDYKQRTVKVYDPSVITSGAKQRSSAITLQGVVDYETAYKEAQFQLNLNRFILKTVNFSAPLEAVACSVGDLVYVQHDMTEWAQAGRFEAGSTLSVVKLDRDVSLEQGKQYKLLVAHNAVQRCAGSIVNVVGTSVFLTGFSGASTVKRIQINGRDLRVAGTFNQGNGYGVILDDTTGITAGNAYSLWDTDVIEEFNVVNLAGTAGVKSSTLMLQSAMTFLPEQFGNWMFGEAEKVKRSFRIKSISGSHEYTRDITALEYRPEVYDFSRYGTNAPVIPTRPWKISPVRALQVYEETYIVAEAVTTQVVASWRASEFGSYSGADVYMKIGEGAMALVADAKNSSSAVIAAAKGDTVTVKVVAYDIFGKRSAYDEAPEVTYEVIGELIGVTTGNVTGVNFFWSGRDCKVNWRYNSATHSYELGSEPNGADAGALDPSFKDYEVKVFNGDDETLRRTDYVTDNSYTYIYDKNFADGVTRWLIFEIRMRDISNNLSPPASMSAYNPPPKIDSAHTSASFETAVVEYTHTPDPDFAGARLWLSTDATELVVLKDANIAYTGPNSSILLSNLIWDKDYYYRLAAYDDFGFTELQPSEVLNFKTTYLNTDAIAEGMLSGSVLIPELQARINLIDDEAATPGSVNFRIAELESIAEDMVNGLGLSVNAKIDTLEDSVFSPTTGLPSATAAINAINDVKATSTSAAARQLSQVKATVNDPATGLAAAQSKITSLNDVSATTTSANAANLFTLKAVVNNPTTGLASAQSKITSLNDVSATSDSAAARSLYTLKASVENPTTGLSASRALITQLNDISATSGSANARSVFQLNSRLDNVGGVSMEQKFSTSADALGGLAAQYTVKIDNDGHVSGFGLASTPINGVPTSEFIVSADRFAVILPGYPGTYPFTIGVVDGVPRVVMKNALIQDASVGTLKIGGNAVTVPMTHSNPDMNTAFGPGSLTLVGSSSWFELDNNANITVVSFAMALNSGGATNMRTQILLRLQNGGTATILDSSITAHTNAWTPHTVAGAIQVPHAGVWRIETWIGNDWTSSVYSLRRFTTTAFGSKR
jgi:hypothetical protein